jgi:hypothetical protein
LRSPAKPPLTCALACGSRRIYGERKNARPQLTLKAKKEISD